MSLSIIAAMGLNGVIGDAGKLPWRLPADMKHFKATTMGKPVIMGRKTFESIGKPLPGRENIVVSRNADFRAAGCKVVGSLMEAIETTLMAEEAMVIGGAVIYERALPLTKRIYLTRVYSMFPGDAYFPDLTVGNWKQTSREDFDADEKNPYPYSFLQLDRVS